MVCLAAIAGSGLLLGFDREDGGLGAAIGRASAGIGQLGGPDTLIRDFSEFVDSIAPDRTGDPAAAPSIQPDSADPTLGILATAPWRPV